MKSKPLPPPAEVDATFREIGWMIVKPGGQIALTVESVVKLTAEREGLKVRPVYVIDLP